MQKNDFQFWIALWIQRMGANCCNEAMICQTQLCVGFLNFEKDEEELSTTI